MTTPCSRLVRLVRLVPLVQLLPHGPTRHQRQQPEHERSESGQAAISAVIVVPAILLVGLLAILGGRIALAQGAVQSAANEAARAASISRSAAIAAAQGRSTATNTLDNSGITCDQVEVFTDTTSFALPLGTSGPVTVQVQCVVPLADLSPLAVPGAITMTSRASSVLDAFRERT